MPPSAPRLASLDQFRGYTVVAMLFVNFAGGYLVIPTTFQHHHTYCSFADTIMPQFLFAVGFAMRLTFLRRIEQDGAAAAYKKAIWRGLGLFLLACVLYKLTGGFKSWEDVRTQDWPKFFEQLFKRGPFETLAHIGVTTLFVLPVIARGVAPRIIFAVLAGLAHVWISQVWYFKWNLTSPVGIDGGPLAFLTWTIPTIAGSLAYDLDRHATRASIWFIVIGFALMAAAIILMYAFSLKPVLPFSHLNPRDERVIADYWVMSQRTGSVTYPLFGAGFAFVVMAVFRWACDGMGVNVPLFDLFGRHALAAYIIHGMVDNAVSPFVPSNKDGPLTPLWYVLAGFTVYFGICWLFVRYLDRNKLYLRL